MSISNVVHKNRDAIQFEWNDPQQPVIHALQRIMISDVPTLAIDMIMVDENTSILGKYFDIYFIVISLTFL